MEDVLGKAAAGRELSKKPLEGEMKRGKILRATPGRSEEEFGRGSPVVKREVILGLLV